jgi:ABC-type lipoprotein release transport system permease subunit
MFMRPGLALVAAAIVARLGAAAALPQAMTSVLFGVDPLDPVTFAGVPLVLLTDALVATYLPARRVAAISPVEALKGE